MKQTAGHLRLLLVAAKSETVQGLARDLFLLDEHVETAIRHDPASALELLETEPYDAVAADLLLPDDGAAALLTNLHARFPRLVRLIIADDPTHAVFANAAHLAHCLLPRPCDAGTLYETLLDSVASVRRVRDPALSAAVAGILALPEAPLMRRELLSLLADDEIDIERLEEGLTRNPAIVAKIMQVANSAYFGMRGSVTAVGEAVSLLGLDTVRGIITAARLFDTLPTRAASGFPLQELWQHSVASAVMVRRVAWHVRASAAVNRAAFTAALLHDVGKLVMLLAHGEPYATLVRRRDPAARPLWLEEERVFAHHHGNAGALLLELWGLPSTIVEAVALHHTPHRTCDGNATPLTLVHIANALVHGESTTALREAHLDQNYLQRLLLPGQLDAWRTAIGSSA
jgi:putative nucleotidyltransferase with HDIG domain